MEASLSGLLILAGVAPADAVLATLVYRIASYWLPPLAGPSACLLFRHRYGWPVPRRATPGEGGQPAAAASTRTPLRGGLKLGGTGSCRMPEPARLARSGLGC